MKSPLVASSRWVVYLGAIASAGCNQSSATPAAAVELGSGQFVVNSLVLPIDRKHFAYDINGDGHDDNQLGSIISALIASNLDAQSGVDTSIAEGQVSILLQMEPRGMPALKTDTAAGATMYLGTTGKGVQEKNDMGMQISCVNCPDYSGNGTFMIDDSQAAALFTSRFNNNKFSSENPATTTNPISITLKLALVMGGPPIALPVHGTHIQFTAGKDADGNVVLTDGEIHGSIKDSDVKNLIVPGVATSLSAEVKADMCMGSSKQIAQVFDLGGCTNPDMTMAMKGDCKIDECELSTNALIVNVLAPDVQIYDAGGNYAPNKLNTTRDSLSLGIGFTAVRAKF